MQIKVGLENGFEGKSIAWVLDHPGCFAYGTDVSEAVVRVPQALIAYKEWIAEHTPTSWLEDLKDFDVRLTQAVDWFAVDKDFERDPNGLGVNAWFQHDWKPLTGVDIQRGLLLLAWSRADLMELIAPLSEAQMERKFEGEKNSISGIIRHVANAEWWLLDRISLAGISRGELANGTFDRLTKNRSRLIEVFQNLEGNSEVRGIDGEFWSPRKVLRRAAWHEKDHIQHIQRLMTLL